MKGLKERHGVPASVAGGCCWILVFLHFLCYAAASSSSSPLDTQAETALLTRVEAKHEMFPTFVYGKSKTGNPVVYKPKLSGLRDFKKFFVLQTDAYMIDLLLQATNSSSYTLVLDFAALSHRLRAPSAEAWDALRRVRDPLPAEARAAVEELVGGVLGRCEAAVVVNAPGLLKLLRPVVSLMVPVSADKLFVSTDLSALYKVVDPSQIPKQYRGNKNKGQPAAGAGAADDLSSSKQTAQLYQLLNARAKALLGRPLNIELPAVEGVAEGEREREKERGKEMRGEAALKKAANAAATAAAAAATAAAATATATATAATTAATTAQEEGDGEDQFDDID
ncbi:hypothetical protein, conserved [Eimeria brunetti]|uniref:CRAL-TRIO domain-containing protein n=1 Tax=Eimeria brunetti TaxID=51314 RepID=U6LMH5_9EIME|nr:hypothetical protein, conserved [Eimeria brunetti]